MSNLFNRNDGTFAAITTADLSGSIVSSIGGLTGTILLSGLTTSGGNTLVAAAAGVTGPGSSTLNNVPQWNSTSGNLLKDGLTVGTAANNLVQLNGSSQLPAVSGALLTGLPPIVSSSTIGVGAATVLIATGGAVNSNNTTAGSNLNTATWDSSSLLVAGGVQTGVWRNISGINIGSNAAGLFVRIS